MNKKGSYVNNNKELYYTSTLILDSHLLDKIFQPQYGSWRPTQVEQLSATEHLCKGSCNISSAVVTISCASMIFKPRIGSPMGTTCNSSMTWGKVDSLDWFRALAILRTCPLSVPMNMTSKRSPSPVLTPASTMISRKSPGFLKW